MIEAGGARTCEPPALPDPTLARSSLLDRLDGVLERPLTLITAPAGYGKTTVAAQWCRDRCPLPVAWVTPRASDEPGALLAKIVDAISTLGPRAAPVLDLDAVLLGCPPAVLAIDGAAGPEPVELFAELAAAIERSPDCGLRVLATSRSAPAPGMAPLRLRGAVAQLDATDLRLTPGELRDLVALVTGAEVGEALADRLCDHLEGWIAGAVLLARGWTAGCTVANYETVLAAAFESITDYLATTVLTRLTPGDLDLLARTACLPELQGDLCDQLLGRSDGHRALRALRSAGVFLASGDGGRGFYRLHRLVRQALELQQADEQRQARETTLRIAVRWYAEHGVPLVAANGLVELGDWDGLAEVLKTHLQDLLARDQGAAMNRVLSAVPRQVLREHGPWLLGMLYLQLADGHATAVLETISAVRSWLSPAALVSAELLRAAAVVHLEEAEPCIDAAEAAMALCDDLGEDYRFADLYTVSRTEHYRSQARGAALLAGALAGAWDRVAPHLVEIEPATAVELPAVALVQLRGRRASYLALGGWLADAAAEAEAALAAVPMDDEFTDRMLADAHVALAEVHRGRADHDQTGEALARALERSLATNRHNTIAAVAASHAHLHVDRGDPEAALRLLADHRRATSHRPPRTLAGMLAAAEGRALAAIGQGKVALRRLSSAPPTALVATALVGAALSTGNRAHAGRTVDAWPDEPTIGSRVRKDLARAAVLASRGAGAESGRLFVAALTTAAPHGLVQPFVGLGTHVLSPLRRAAGKAADPAVADLARRALAALGDGPAVPVHLTEREIVVLHHLAGPGSIPTIADELVVSVNTVKTHLKAIYRKLGVSSRADALAAWRASRRGEPS